MKTPPPLIFLSYLRARYGAGKVSELECELFKCDSVPKIMSGCLESISA